METREAELMRASRLTASRTSRCRTTHGRGVLEPPRRGASTPTHRRPLQWDGNFRGVDQSIADVWPTGFGSRTLLCGEGPVVKSPPTCASPPGAPTEAALAEAAPVVGKAP